MEVIFADGLAGKGTIETSYTILTFSICRSGRPVFASLVQFSDRIEKPHEHDVNIELVHKLYISDATLVSGKLHDHFKPILSGATLRFSLILPRTYDVE
jgi:hypothetical protein